MCRIHKHILSTHSVLLDTLTVSIHVIHHMYTYIYTSIHTQYAKVQQIISYVSWCALKPPDVLDLCSVCVVQLNCVKVKVQCMAYRKVGVCCRVYYFWKLKIYYNKTHHWLLPDSESFTSVHFKAQPQTLAPLFTFRSLNTDLNS